VEEDSWLQGDEVELLVEEVEASGYHRLQSWDGLFGIKHMSHCSSTPLTITAPSL